MITTNTIPISVETLALIPNPSLKEMVEKDPEFAEKLKELAPLLFQRALALTVEELSTDIHFLLSRKLCLIDVIALASTSKTMRESIGKILSGLFNQGWGSIFTEIQRMKYDLCQDRYKSAAYRTSPEWGFPAGLRAAAIEVCGDVILTPEGSSVEDVEWVYDNLNAIMESERPQILINTLAKNLAGILRGGAYAPHPSFQNETIKQLALFETGDAFFFEERGLEVESIEAMEAIEETINMWIENEFQSHIEGPFIKKIKDRLFPKGWTRIPRDRMERIIKTSAKLMIGEFLHSDSRSLVEGRLDNDNSYDANLRRLAWYRRGCDEGIDCPFRPKLELPGQQVSYFDGPLPDGVLSAFCNLSKISNLKFPIRDSIPSDVLLFPNLKEISVQLMDEGVFMSYITLLCKLPNNCSLQFSMSTKNREEFSALLGRIDEIDSFKNKWRYEHIRICSVSQLKEAVLCAQTEELEYSQLNA